jgi:stage III sporulation protein AD
MEQIFSICALGVLGAAFYAALKRTNPEYAMGLAAVCSVLILLSAVKLFAPILNFLRQLQKLSGVSGAVLSPLLKTVAIGFLTQISGAYCLDAGEQSLAKAVELSGTLLAAYAALPLASQVTELLQRLMEG